MRVSFPARFSDACQIHDSPEEWAPVMLKLKTPDFALCSFISVLLAGCAAPKPPPAGPFLQGFQARGVVREISADRKSVVISREEIPGYLPAMVMPLPVKHTNDLDGLQAGDTVTFQLMVGATNNWVDQIKKLDGPR